MKGQTSSRRGSALLIVLGMLSFMIVSAVGFAAYMRYSRLPSSYLRRTNSARLLVKAAVAEGINAVDFAVCNNYHPNVGYKSVGRDRRSHPYDANRTMNVWRHRVLMATNANATAILNASSVEDIGYETVPTLCLEALAYIPPPLVNEARFYSRITPTARWKPLGFDAGRYSFVALDVSDYFDVNRLLADIPRSSAASRRITLSYLFEDQHHRNAPSGAESWDESFMSQFRKYDANTFSLDFKGKFPLVSMADFNLALGKKGSVGQFKSPFYRFVKENAPNFYGSGAGTDSVDFETFRRMTFVTDGIYRENLTATYTDNNGNKHTEKLLSLSDSRNQPFKMDDLDNKGGKMQGLTGSLMGQSMQNRDDWKELISRLGCAALFDYLDADHIPVSVALPTVERTPMICGLGISKFNGSQLLIKKDVTPGYGSSTDPTSKDFGAEDAPPNAQSRKAKVTVRYKLDPKIVEGFMGGTLKSLVVFPFSHADGDDGNFEMDGRFALFLSSEKMSLRTSPTDVIHLKKDIDESGFLDNGLISAKLDSKQIAKFTNVKESRDALRLVDYSLRGGTKASTELGMDGNALLEVVYEWNQDNNNNAGGLPGNASWSPTWSNLNKKDKTKITGAKCAIPIVTAGGVVDTKFRNSDELMGLITGGGTEIRLNGGAWMRIKDTKSGNKVVDMVPACILDDKEQNSLPDANTIYQGLASRLGTGYPLMKFNTGVVFNFSIDGLDAIADKPKDVTISPTTLIVADPRYNYAPEHWFSLGEALSENAWLNNNKLGDGDRDNDIFMATSDSGYLQSIYELAMLPRFTNLRTFGNDETLGNLESPSGKGLDSIPGSFNDIANKDFMWRTYDPFDIDRGAFDELPWTSEGAGFKVNPYSDSTNVLMAAFANTPIDWKRASTNDVGFEDYAMMKSADFNRKYAFNEYSQDTRVSWNFLQGVAGRLHYLVRDCAANNQGWTTAWQRMEWYYDKDRFCGLDLDDKTDSLNLADRKFLYGYWRECLGVKQQLYLIFARAEPTMMGGDASGQLPPQLGARAMALVWRDPASTQDNNGRYVPHQTRVLFYRQFE